MCILQEMRPYQWTKNILVYAALLFGGSLFVEGKLLLVTMAFCSFCLAGSGVYFFNDIVDAENDRYNPKKCNRPIASGKISIIQAYIWSILLWLVGGLLAYMVNVGCFCHILTYVIINICYTLRLKHVVIIDVMIIASGFVLRAVMGAIAIGMEMTMWFLLCVTFLSLFLALGKRRHELAALADNEITRGRKVLRFYSIDLIDQLMAIAATALILLLRNCRLCWQSTRHCCRKARMWLLSSVRVRCPMRRKWSIRTTIRCCVRKSSSISWLCPRKPQSSRQQAKPAANSLRREKQMGRVISMIS
ncbi:UbiA prenyltransferase family protein [Selenomonas caprae]|uniref:UbiA prenyltransferase family protein n=1 Tax=Selenomonas caprae TaxID=2606905 RepID=A0A5D6WSL8_9FIRM|nr:UbiA prenyltransferase family protein [Selenomonas caprae]